MTNTLASERSTKQVLTESELNQETESAVADRQAEERATSLLQSHSHFRGRETWVHCHCSKRCLRLSGILPSYYLKQLAQETVRRLEGIDKIENQIVVANPNGIDDGNDLTQEANREIENPGST